MYFFLRDASQKFRFFSSEPPARIPVQFSKPREIWEAAKKKLMLLPARVLRQEQAFMRVRKIEDETISIHHSGLRPEKRVRLRFSLFLVKQRSKHILILIGEALLLPLSGLAALLPGPNVAFAALALLMITHWRALQGINRLFRKRLDFTVAPLFADWEAASDRGQVDRCLQILKRIESEYRLFQINKILCK